MGLNRCAIYFLVDVLTVHTLADLAEATKNLSGLATRLGFDLTNDIAPLKHRHNYIGGSTAVANEILLVCLSRKNRPVM